MLLSEDSCTFAGWIIPQVPVIPYQWSEAKFVFDFFPLGIIHPHDGRFNRPDAASGKLLQLVQAARTQNVIQASIVRDLFMALNR